MFRKAADIESRHVDSIMAALNDYGGEPAHLAVLAPAAALVSGVITSASLAIALRADIALENIAMRDYKKLIAACDDKRLRDTLWSNCLDESLHREWFKARLRKDVDLSGMAEVEFKPH